jgi:hypothetical protein
MKKRSFNSRYLHLATKKPLFFYSVLLFGVGIFLYLTMTTKIETGTGSYSLLHMIFIQVGKGL